MRLVIFILLLCFSNIALSQKDNRFKFTPKKYTHSLQFTLENGVIVSNGTQKSNQLIDRSYYNGLDLKFGWTKKDMENSHYRKYSFYFAFSKIVKQVLVVAKSDKKFQA